MLSHFLLLLTALALTSAQRPIAEPQPPVTGTTVSPSTAENVVTDKPRVPATMGTDTRAPTTRRFRPTTRSPFYTTMRYRTYPPTPRGGCYHDGKWYRTGEEMSRGYDGRNWCYGSYCDRGSVTYWDNWNCGPTTLSTTRPPRPHSTPQIPYTTPPRPYTPRYWSTRRSTPSRTTRRFRVTTRRQRYTPRQPTPISTTRRFRPTTRRPFYTTMRYRTYPPTWPRDGCYHNGKWYKPGEEMSRGYDGRNWCYGLYCDHNGQAIPWDDWNCYPTTMPRTPPRPYTPRYWSTRRPTPRRTTRRFRVTTQRPRYTPRQPTPISTTRRFRTGWPDFTTFPPTFPGGHGCYHNGKWYKPGEEMSRGYDGRNWCYGLYCDHNGQAIPWDDWNCGPTTMPRTPPRPYTPKYWSTRRPTPRRTTRRFRVTTQRPRYTPRQPTPISTTRRFRTAWPDFTTFPPTFPGGHGCYHNGKWYKPGEEMYRGYDGRNWCYGSYCDNDGQAIAWDDWNCGPTTMLTTPPRPYTPRYWSTRRPTPRRTTRRFRVTTQRPRLDTHTPTPSRHGCFYKGKWYAPGEEISRGNKGSDWCYGKYCSQRGDVVAWHDVPCGTTPPTSTTTGTPFPTTYPPMPPTTRRSGCYYNGRWYPPDTEISRGSSYGFCHGTVCDRSGQILMWDDWRCSTTAEPTTTPPPPPTVPIRGCFYRGTWYPPNRDIFESSNGNGWCYGRRCSSDGQMVVWDNFSCRQVKFATGGCWYGGYLYSYGTELFRKDHSRCFGGICQQNGSIKSWKRLNCRMENRILGGRLRPSWCKYRGQLYPRGSVVFSRSLSKKHGFGWCFGAKCGENGRIVTWGPMWAPGQC